MAVAGDQRDPGQPAGHQRAQERQPASAVLTGDDVEAEDLPLPVAVHADRDQGVHQDRAAALANPLSQGVDPDKVYGPASSGRVRNAATSSSRLRAISLT